MIQWLQNYSGIKSSGENIEKTELENLRKEVKRYKKKYEQEDKEMEVSSESEEDITPEEQKKIDEETKVANILLSGLLLMSIAMLSWTFVYVNTIGELNNTNTPIVSAFNA